MANGYAGKILNIDLSRRRVWAQGLNVDITDKFLGGMGYGTKILYDEVGPDADPLGADNTIVLATGPLTGTNAPSAGRVHITAKSPLTGAIGTGNTGGTWGVELKRAGYDAIIVRGVSPEPVSIWIDGQKVQIIDAAHLWGKDIWEVTPILGRELGESTPEEIKVMAIGPAGENRVRFACLINEYYHAQGRSGIGAVLGSKKVKAIAVRGKGEIGVAKPDEFHEAVAQAVKSVIHAWGPGLQRPGGPSPHKLYTRYGALPFGRYIFQDGALSGRNFQTTDLPYWPEEMTLEAAEKYITGHYGDCYKCPMSCFNMVEVNEGKYAGLKISTGTMIAPLLLFGARCGIQNLPAIWKCKELCHRLGMDIASAAGVVAFATELYQRGIITREDTGGISLDWGDEDAILLLLEQIAYRRGLGDVLAEGSDLAAQRIGKEASRYAMTVKRSEIMGGDPRATARLPALGYLDNPRGGDNVLTAHTHIDRMPSSEVIRQNFGMTPEQYWKEYVASLDIFPEEKARMFGSTPVSGDSYQGKPALLKWMGDYSSALNTLVVCILPAVVLGGLGPTCLARLLSTATGKEVTPQELMKIGERVFTLARMYLVKCGLDSRADVWPERFYAEGLADGPRAGSRLDKAEVDRALREYYELRGWDRNTGIPTPEKLAELGLQW